MSKKYPDSYSGTYNSDKYTISDTTDKVEEYSSIDAVLDSGGILSNNEEGAGTKKITVESDDNYYKEVYSLYSNVLNASGMNLLDPYTAYLTHFNKLQRRNIDPAYSGKTYIFITRPDLNFWEKSTGLANVELVDLFSYFSRMNIGLSIMPWLMFPHRMNMEFENGNKHLRTRRDRIGSTYLFDRNRGSASIKNNAFTPFIPLLSNFCVSTSGGQDLSLDTEETEGDLHGNKLMYAKGADASFAPGEITLEFDDVWGSPIMHLINLWVHYIHYLTKGVVNTWTKYVQYRIIDYSCSIYIFETDKDNTTITRWVKYTGCFPKSVPLGNIQHNLENDPEKLRKLSIPFAYNRCEPMKPAVLNDFNFLMNKFILDDSKENREYIKATGTAPSKLIIPYKDYSVEQILNRDSAIIKPSHYEYVLNSDKRTYSKEITTNNTNYYDNKFWGAIPYILNHKLMWIDPNVLYNKFDSINQRSKSVDTTVAKARASMINTTA